MKRPFINILFAFLFSLLACQPKPSLSPTSTVPGECTQVGETWVSPIDGAGLMCVPAGEFMMGAGNDDPLAEENEKPQHRVNLDAYWIDRTEVTNANFAKCLAANACHPKQYETNAAGYVPYSVHPEYQDFPAVLYEADAAAEYCQWAGRRLPSEAEWEKAAHGYEARVYPWGNGPLDCEHVNYFLCDPFVDPQSTTPSCGNSAHCKTSSVDSYTLGASPYGVLNMAGNVWEFVADFYQADYYSISPVDNPKGPAQGEYHVIRGGGAKSISQDLRTTRRANGAPEHYMDGQMGFRCAADVQVP